MSHFYPLPLYNYITDNHFLTFLFLKLTEGPEDNEDKATDNETDNDNDDINNDDNDNDDNSDNDSDNDNDSDKDNLMDAGNLRFMNEDQFDPEDDCIELQPCLFNYTRVHHTLIYTSTNKTPSMGICIYKQAIILHKQNSQTLRYTLHVLFYQGIHRSTGVS
jgi:hypothetical protein